MKKYLRRVSNKFLLFLFRITRTNPLLFAYNNMGILNAANEHESGELYFMHEILSKHLSPNPIFFDIGANIGNYTRMLTTTFPQASVYSFEPNPATFSLLKKNVEKIDRVEALPIGFGKEKSHIKIYNYKKSDSSQHASIYKEVFTDLHKDSDIVSFDIDIDTLDDFCTKNNINEIDFVKIDTEGNEYDVLSGARQLIMNNRIKIIQFEFNEMNIISRIFLKDFYEILAGYNIYRLLPEKLLPIFSYDSMNEIFKFQNIVAIKKDIFISNA